MCCTQTLSAVSLKYLLTRQHERNNLVVKGEGGVIGITSNENALNRWLVAGIEVFRLLDQLQSSIHACKNSYSLLKYEQYPTGQNKFVIKLSL